MTDTKTVEVVRFPGEHYPVDCLKCYELLSDNYGCTKFDKCSMCQFADVSGCELIQIKTDQGEKFIKIMRS